MNGMATSPGIANMPKTAGSAMAKTLTMNIAGFAFTVNGMATSPGITNRPKTAGSAMAGKNMEVYG